MKTKKSVRTTKALLKRERVKLCALTVGGFLASLLPLAILFALRWEVYTRVPAGGLRLCFGGGVIALLMLLKVMGKIKLPSRLTVMVLALVLVYLLEALLTDLALILWVALIGEALDALIFAPLLRRTRDRISRLSQADTTAGAVEELLKQYVGGKQA